MTPLARLDTLTLLAELVLLITIGILGAHSVDTWNDGSVQRAQIRDMRSALRFSETFMAHCLNGKTLIVGRVAGVMCVRL